MWCAACRRLWLQAKHFGAVQLPDISTPPHAQHANLYAHVTGGGGGKGFRGSAYVPPSYQNWMQHGSVGGSPTVTIVQGASPQTTPRRTHPPYVSTTVPSLAKPLTVQYHPVLRPQAGGGGAATLHAAPLAAEDGPVAPRSSVPSTPEGGTSTSSRAPLPDGTAAAAGLPVSVSEAEAVRRRHTSELDGVISGIQRDLAVGMAGSGAQPKVRRGGGAAGILRRAGGGDGSASSSACIQG